MNNVENQNTNNKLLLFISLNYSPIPYLIQAIQIKAFINLILVFFVSLIEIDKNESNSFYQILDDVLSNWVKLYTA